MKLKAEDEKQQSQAQKGNLIPRSSVVTLFPSLKSNVGDGTFYPAKWCSEGQCPLSGTGAI